MVFGKQHLSLFVTLAFLLVFANAVPPPTSIDKNVERLRGDLHQFIEMIISCLVNSKTSNPQIGPSSQLNQFKQITNSLQEDVGLGTEATPEKTEQAMRKFGLGDEILYETSSEVPSNEVESYSETNEEPTSNSKETIEGGVTKETSDADSGHDNREENENRRAFNLQEGDGHNYTPRPSSQEITDSGSAERTATMSTTNPYTNNPQEGSDIDLRILPPGSKEDTSDTSQNQASPEAKTTSSEDEKPPSLNNRDLKDIIKSQIGKMHKAFKINTKKNKPKGGRKSIGEGSTSGNSNESKDNNPDEIQMRNLVKEAPNFATGSSIDPYEALHIYGIKMDGPINKIVFEGGEHHPPRPLTVKESNYLKQFIKMVINTNKLHNPMATFPPGDEISPRSGFGGGFKKKSPWADKPVPLELV